MEKRIGGEMMQRYRIHAKDDGGYLEKYDDGNLVLFSDAQGEVEARDCEVEKYANHCVRLEADNAALRKEVERMKGVLVGLLAHMGICNDAKQTVEYLTKKALQARELFQRYKDLCDGEPTKPQTALRKEEG
jgi:hypothetical protein